MALIDQFKKLFAGAAARELSEEISPVNAALGRPPFQEFLADTLNPYRMGQAMRAAKMGNTLEWMLIAEEMEERWPHYSAVLAKRRRAVAQLPIVVESADPDDAACNEHADYVSAWVKGDVLEQAIFDIMDAIPKGYSVHEIIWQLGTDVAEPSDLIYRPQRFFELSWEDGATLWLRTENGFEPLQPHKFLVHVAQAKSGLVSRSGITFMLAWMFMGSAYTMRDWARFVQQYGLPITLGKYGPQASQSDKSVLWRAVRSVVGDVAAILPTSMTIDFVEPKELAAGAKLFESRADWLNKECSKLVLGSTAGTDAIAGSHAIGREHRQVEEDVERADARLLAATLNRQIVQTMVALRFGPQARYPRLVIGRPDEVPLKEVVDAAARLGPLGLKLPAAEIRARLQMGTPAEGDEVIGGLRDPQAPPSEAGAYDPPADGGGDDALNSLFASAPLGGALTRVMRNSAARPELLDRMTDRLARDAAGALAGLTDAVRAEFNAATSLHDLAARLHALKLDGAPFAEAMARGMALAQMAGRAEVLEEIEHQAPKLNAALTAKERAALPASMFAWPAKRALPIRDADHVEQAWRELGRTQGMTGAERAEARRRILARAKLLRIDTSGWTGATDA